MNIYDLVVKYIKLQKKGNTYWGLCPFHKEKTPSFTVSIDKNCFHCFGCGNHGGVVQFLQQIENISFEDALTKLNYKSNYNQYKEEISELQKQLNFYTQNKNDLVKNYLKEREIREETSNFFMLGYALEEYNGKRDFFRNRLIFPIFSRKCLIGFSGRVLDNSKPKYLNSAESDLFQKSSILYNIHNIKMGTIHIVEGFFDVLRMWQEGFTNVVAIMGSILSEYHINTLLRISKEWCFIFDGDSAGYKVIINSLNNILKSIDHTIKIYVVELSNGDDPDSFLRKYGAYKLCKLISKKKTLSEWVIKHQLKNDLNNTIESRANKNAFFHSIIQSISNPYLKKEYYNAFYKKKQNIQITQIENQEAVLLNLIVNNLNNIDDFIEKLMIYRFKNPIFDEIREYIIDEITMKNTEISVLFTNLLKKYEKYSDFITNLTENQYIIGNKEFCMQYLLDMLNIVPKGENHG